MRAQGIDQRGGWLDAFDVPQLPQPIEEKSVTAADIEDRVRKRPGHKPLQLGEQNFFSGTPPPVLLVEFAIMPGVFRIQLRSLDDALRTVSRSLSEISVREFLW